jgi:hypothetical protein
MASIAAMIHISPQKSAFTRRQLTNIISTLMLGHGGRFVVGAWAASRLLPSGRVRRFAYSRWSKPPAGVAAPMRLPAPHVAGGDQRRDLLVTEQAQQSARLPCSSRGSRGLRVLQWMRRVRMAAGPRLDLLAPIRIATV